MRIIAGFGAAFLILIMAGCWNRTELNELWVVTASGLDRSNGQWVGSFQIIVPSGIAAGTGGSGSVSGSASHVFSVKSKALYEALNLSNLQTSRRIYTAHNRIILIGREAAEEGIGELIDYYHRNTEARESVMLLITEGRASEMLKKNFSPEKLPGAAYAEMTKKESSLVSIFPAVSMYDFTLGIFSDSKGVGVPVLALTGDMDEEKKVKMESQKVFDQTSPPQRILLSKLALFQGDHLAGFLDREQSMGISWINNKIKRAQLTVPCNKHQGASEYFSYGIDSSNTKLMPAKSRHHYRMHILVTVKGTLRVSNCLTDLSKPEVIKEMQKQIEKEIEKKILVGWEEIQRMGIDCVGFADKVHRKYPGKWKSIEDNWPEEFKRIELDVQVKASITRPGFIQESLQASKGAKTE